MQDSDEEFVPEEEEGQGPGALKRLREKLAEAVKEKQEYLDGWQRSRADFANVKRQFEEEKASLKSFAAALSVQAFLPALESLNRAKEHGKLSGDFAGVAKQIEEGFSQLGLKKIEPEVGDEFDPREHEALQQEEVGDEDRDGKIVKVLDAGWKTGDQILRPARVILGSYKK